MNKGQMPGYVLGLIMLVLLVLLGLFLVKQFGFDTAREAGALSACEQGIAGSTEGMCTANTFCPSEANSKGKSGCPSSVFKSASKGKGLVTKDYDLCCVVNTCGDISDEVANSVNGERVPRVKANLTEAGSACVGFARDCSKDGDCCCVIGKTSK